MWLTAPWFGFVPAKVLCLLGYNRSVRTIVYIDGQNFMYKAADILIASGVISNKQELTKIDIRSLIENICGKDDIEIKYYGAKIRINKSLGSAIEEKSRRFSDNLRQIRNTLAKQHITFVESGKLKIRDGDLCSNCGSQDKHFQEKGVDVGIAVDLVVDKILNGPDEVTRQVLISSDTDLIPAIKAVQSVGGEVVYIGFSDKLTKAIVAEADKTQIIRDSEVLAAYDAMNPPKLNV